MKHRLIQVYWILGVFVVGFAAVMKLWTASGEELWLSVPDAIFPHLTVRRLMIVVGALELIACVSIVQVENVQFKISLLCTLGGMVLSYRIYRWILGVAEGCQCFGKAPAVMGLSSLQAELIAGLIAGGLFLGGWVSIWMMGKSSPKGTEPG